MSLQFKSLLFGLIAIVFWASVATLGNFLNHLPPFYVLGIAFLFGAIPALLKPREIFPSLKVTLWGILGYFSYHFFLFYSLRHAPAIEANLINYLWPMILVLLTPLFFSGLKLGFHHLMGAGLSVIGVVVLVIGKGVDLRLENFWGHLLAFGAALSWPLYSLGKKKMVQTKVWSVGGACLGAGLLCLGTHFWIEPHVTLVGHDAWVIFFLGIGPLGLSFYAWDLAMSAGDSRVIGALSYLTPVLSTLGLVVFADQALTPTTALAMILIIGGASSGLLDIFPSKVLKKG